MVFNFKCYGMGCLDFFRKVGFQQTQEIHLFLSSPNLIQTLRHCAKSIPNQKQICRLSRYLTIEKNKFADCRSHFTYTDSQFVLRLKKFTYPHRLSISNGKPIPRRWQTRQCPQLPSPRCEVCLTVPSSVTYMQGLVLLLSLASLSRS